MAEIEINSINFNKASGVFCDGETVSGVVVIRIENGIDVKEIRAEAYGIASVSLNTKKYNSSVPKIDKFFTWSKVLTQEKRPLGYLEYHFEFKLPYELPSSCDGTYGKINYGMTIYFKTSTYCHILASKPFTVSAGLNLSYIPEAAARIDICKYQALGLCCLEEILSARWKVSSSGFLPKDVVSIKTIIEDDGFHAVKLEDTILYKVMIYKESNKKKKVERIELARAELGMFVNKDGIIDKVEFLTIPETPVSGRCRNRLVDISYELEFKADIKGGKTLVATAEVFIGSVHIDREVMKSYARETFRRKEPIYFKVDNQHVLPFNPYFSNRHGLTGDNFRESVERHSPPPSYDFSNRYYSHLSQ